MTPFLHPKLHLASIFYFSKLLKSFPGTVRIHSKLAAQLPSARLWYFLRGLDNQGRGCISFKIDDVASIFLGCGKSTLYQWLREGKEIGLFRSYRKDRKSGEMRVFLGGLHAVCVKNGITDWGKVGLVPLCEVLSLYTLRATASAVATQALQNESRYAAKRNNKNSEKRRRVISSADLFDWVQPPCLKSGKRVKGASIIHVSKKLAFVGSRFVPFGVSQELVASSIGRNQRTVRRYLSYLGVDRRQLCQTNAEYSEIKAAIEWESPYYESDKTLLVACQDGYYFSDGSIPTKKVKPIKMSAGRFFQYAGHTWLRRCNLYNLNQRICTMSAARKVLGKLIKKNEAARPSPEGLHGVASISFSNISDNFGENGTLSAIAKEPD